MSLPHLQYSLSKKENPSFPIKRGVRRGDAISPKLFISCLQQVFNKLNDKWNPKGYGIKIGNEAINNLRFEDGENSQRATTDVGGSALNERTDRLENDYVKNKDHVQYEDYAKS